MEIYYFFIVYFTGVFSCLAENWKRIGSFEIFERFEKGKCIAKYDIARIIYQKVPFSFLGVPPAFLFCWRMCQFRLQVRQIKKPCQTRQNLHNI